MITKYNTVFGLFISCLVDKVPFGHEKSELLNRFEKICEEKDDWMIMNMYYWTRTL